MSCQSRVSPVSARVPRSAGAQLTASSRAAHGLVSAGAHAAFRGGRLTHPERTRATARGRPGFLASTFGVRSHAFLVRFRPEWQTWFFGKHLRPWLTPPLAAFLLACDQTFGPPGRKRKDTASTSPGCEQIRYLGDERVFRPMASFRSISTVRRSDLATAPCCAPRKKSLCAQHGPVRGPSRRSCQHREPEIIGSGDSANTYSSFPYVHQHQRTLPCEPFA